MDHASSPARYSANAAWLKVNPGQVLMIEGHSDERGTVEYNVALGDRRATATLTNDAPRWTLVDARPDGVIDRALAL